MPSVHTSRMHLTRRLTLAGILIALPSLGAAGGQTEPLADPIPATIQKGDLVVGAEEFVRVPRTSDSSEGGQTNPAYARIQFLVPIGDGSGRLLGHLPSIRPVLPRTSLLPVREVAEDEVGEEVWRVNVGDDDLPELLLNSSVTGISEIVRTDKTFRSLVMPAVLRSVLTHALIDQRANPEDDEVSSWNGWFRLAESLHPGAEIPSLGFEAEESTINAAREWIEAVVRTFAKERVFAAGAYDAAWRLGA